MSKCGEPTKFFAAMTIRGSVPHHSAPLLLPPLRAVLTFLVTLAKLSLLQALRVKLAPSLYPITIRSPRGRAARAFATMTPVKAYPGSKRVIASTSRSQSARSTARQHRIVVRNAMRVTSTIEAPRHTKKRYEGGKHHEVPHHSEKRYDGGELMRYRGAAQASATP